MSEPIEWMPDGTPYSPRFGDRYHSEDGGLTQARSTFLQGCGLPAAWAGQPHWRILETGFGFGLNFLVTWAAWRADPARCRVLHFTSCEAWPVGADDLLRAASQHADLLPLARQLHAQWWGLLPGVHRLAFDEGRVLLTLFVGDAPALLRQQTPQADSIYLDGFSPQRNPGMWDAQMLKTIARCCRRGTRLATWTISRPVRDALAQCGFTVQKVPGAPPKRDNLQATFDPAWEPRAAAVPPVGSPAAAAVVAAVAAKLPGDCLVIGGGLSGAAVAASLARRGWQVQVLDRGAQPAAGASGLPAGVFAPHVSPDDNLLSRLSRSGVRATLQALASSTRLLEGEDWSASGVLERALDGKLRLPAAWTAGANDSDNDNERAATAASAGAQWSRPADAATLAAAGLPASAAACWHARAGWLQPARLVRALLESPAIAWQGSATVAGLQQVTGADGSPRWQALAADGAVLAEAAYAVITAGYDSRAWLPSHYPLNALRGQISWGLRAEAPPGAAAAWPPFPVNGHGNLVPQAGRGAQARWVMGSTFERGETQLPPTPAAQAEAHAVNAAKLELLLPGLAAGLVPALAGPAAAPRHWAAVRCTAPDRLPFVGPVDPVRQPGLWVCTAMGARGITLAPLCGELLAARMTGEPLPIDVRLARALATERLGTVGDRERQ